MYKIFTFYNHKGGVSKTTTSFNTGAYLAKEKKKKVLLVDVDPQSNLSELFFSSISDENEIPGTSIYDALKSRFIGGTTKIDVTKIQLAQHSIYPNLYLLKGDFNFSQAETYFGNAVNQAITENIHEKFTYLSLFRLLNDLINLHNFDHVILDLGPSTGAIARMSLLCCDAFMVPITPDRFCNQAVISLNQIITSWINKHQETVKTFEPYGLEQFAGQPKFLGAISQNFKAYAGKTKRPYEIWEQIIKESIFDSIIKNDLIPKDKRVYTDGVYISTISDFGPLGVVAQVSGKAIFDLDKDDTKLISASGSPWAGVALDSWLKRARNYEAGIEKIATVVL